MRIKEDISPMAFLSAVNTCKGQIWFCTKEQDRLNLKSVLSQYIFATLVNTDILDGAWIVCDDQEDEVFLNSYLE